MANTTVIGALRVMLGLDSAEFEEGADSIQRRAKQMERSFEKLGGRMQKLGRNLTIGITAPLAVFAKKSIDGAIAQQKAMADVEAALESMGDASGKTAKELLKTSDALELNSMFDGDQILKDVTANLLTFGNVADEQFDRAQQAALDMATRLGKGPKEAAIQLGKALNDPIRGINAMSDAGVQFTESQRSAIKALVETGKTAEAQKIILAEVEKQFRGAAAAAADADPWRKAQVAIGQSMDAIGEAILPAIKPITEAIVSIANAFNNLSPGMQKAVVIAAALAAALGPVMVGLGGLVTAAAPFLGTIKAIAASQGVFAALAAGSTGLIAALGPLAVAIGAVYLAWKNWDDIAPRLQPLVDELGDIGRGLGLLEGKVSAAVGKFESDFDVLIDAAKRAGGETQQSAENIRSALAKMRETGVIDPAVTRSITELTATMENAGQITPEEAAKIRKSLLGMWTAQDAAQQKSEWEKLGEQLRGVSEQLQTFADNIDLFLDDWTNFWRVSLPGAIEQGWRDAERWLTALVTGVQRWIVDRLGAVWRAAMDKIEQVKRAFFNLYDAVVGNSYIPDMVDGIAAHMARLDQAMVDPARDAAKKTGDAFRDMAGEVRSLLDRLFPQAAQLRGMLDDLKLLDQAEAAGLISPEIRTAARFRAVGGNREVDVPDWLGRDDPLPAAARVEEAAQKAADAMAKMATKGTVQTVRLAKSFADMARDITGSLRSLVGAIKGGGFFDIVDGLLGLFTSLGSSGLFGSKIQTRLNAPIPGFASGGSFQFGGKAGIDRNLLSLNGSPIARVSKGEMAHIVPANSNSRTAPGQNGVLTVRLEKDGEMTAYLEGIAGRVVGAAAPAIISAGGEAGVNRMTRLQQRRLG